MNAIKKNLEDLGITLPEVPVPLAAYIPAQRAGDLIIVSGQLPSVDGDFSAYCGNVPNEIPVEKAQKAAEICFINNLAAALSLLEYGETLQLVQIQGFVQSAADFHEQPAVINGASEMAIKILGENGKHARVAVGVNALPKNVCVEVACTFQVVPEAANFSGSMNWIS